MCRYCRYSVSILTKYHLDGLGGEGVSEGAGLLCCRGRGGFGRGRGGHILGVSAAEAEQFGGGELLRRVWSHGSTDLADNFY